MKHTFLWNCNIDLSMLEVPPGQPDPILSGDENLASCGGLCDELEQA